MNAGPPHAARIVSDASEAANGATGTTDIRASFAEAVKQEGLGQLKSAEESYRRILEHAPGHVESLHNLGVLLRRLGCMDEAEELFRKVLAIRPDVCMTIYQLAQTRRYESAEHEDAERIRKLLNLARLPARDAVFLRFSLGKILNDCGEFESAFDNFRQGNALLHKSSRYDRQSFEWYVDLVIDTFTPALMEALRPFSNPSELPVFIVGMPRSGTTLLEQILSAHPLVHAAGELTLIDQAIKNLRMRGNIEEDYPVLVKHLPGKVLASEAENYESFIRGLVERDAVRFVDKMPYNFRCVGLIGLLFGQARVIHCRREPRDVCLSNYFQLYVGSHEHTYSLRDLGHYYRQYERLMDHWRGLFDPSRFLEVDYEALVTDTGAKAPELVEFLGLEWDERCLKPHESDRTVNTASAWQVRQPIHSASVSRWKNYEKFLGPLDKALAGD